LTMNPPCRGLSETGKQRTSLGKGRAKSVRRRNVTVTIQDLGRIGELLGAWEA